MIKRIGIKTFLCTLSCVAAVQCMEQNIEQALQEATGLLQALGLSEKNSAEQSANLVIAGQDVIERSPTPRPDKQQEMLNPDEQDMIELYQEVKPAHVYWETEPDKISVYVPVETCCYSTIISASINEHLEYDGQLPKEIQIFANPGKIRDLLYKEQELCMHTQEGYIDRYLDQQAQLFISRSDLHRIVEFLVLAYQLDVPLVKRLFTQGLAYALTNLKVLKDFAQKNAQAHITALQKLPQGIKNKVFDAVVALKESDLRQILPLAGQALMQSSVKPGSYKKDDWHIEYDDTIITVKYIPLSKNYMFSITSFTLEQLIHMLALADLMGERNSRSVPQYFTDIKRSAAIVFWSHVLPQGVAKNLFKI